MRSVIVKILHRLADEGRAGDAASDEIGMAEVHAGVEDGDLDAGAAARARRNAACGEAPSRAEDKSLFFVLGNDGNTRRAAEVFGDRLGGAKKSAQIFAGIRRSGVAECAEKLVGDVAGEDEVLRIERCDG